MQTILSLLAFRRAAGEDVDTDAQTQVARSAERRAHTMCLGLAVVLLGLLAHSTTSCEELIDGPVRSVTQPSQERAAQSVGALPAKR